MCGITGIAWHGAAAPVDRDQFDRMTDRLAHRGPDGRGVHWKDYANGDGIALGHRRLSIIDLGGGAQPMCNEDGTVWIAFNGEIYNYRELRPDLERQGHRFRTHSDTETIVHLYEEYGDRFVDYLRGMFAIAIWDERRRRLVLVRDRLGQKPLVYTQQQGALLFASELKSLTCVSTVDKTLRPQAIDEYLLYGYIPHPHTIFANIHKLPPAHLAVFEQGKLSIRRYWSPELAPVADLSLPAAQEMLAEVVGEAVRLRLRSDVPLGAFLSGGIDSTVVVGAMQAQSERRIHTFTIGFPVAEYDESQFAQQAADHLGTQHLRMEMQPDSIEVLQRLAWLFDEPFSDSSAIPTYYLSQLTRQHVTVALTGDGGDELFAGYDRHQTVQQLGRFDRLPSLIRRVLTGPWVDWLPQRSQRSLASRLKHRLTILREPLHRRYASWQTVFQRPLRDALYQPDFRRSIDLEQSLEFVSQAMRSLPAMAPGLQAMRADLATYLPGDLLAKVDITSMAHGLECRSPFLDHRVVETALQMPFELLARPGQVKPLLTSTFGRYFPEALKNRPKMGFRVPLDAWFRSDLTSYTRDVLLSHDAFCHQFFQPTAIEKLLDQQNSGQWNHGDRIWSLLFLETWGQQLLRPAQQALASYSSE